MPYIIVIWVINQLNAIDRGHHLVEIQDTGAVGQTRTGLKQASREEDSQGVSPWDLEVSMIWDLMGFIMGFHQEKWWFTGIYPLVNIQKTMEHHHAMKMGKSTISTGPFSIAICLFTRGYPQVIHWLVVWNMTWFFPSYWECHNHS